MRFQLGQAFGVAAHVDASAGGGEDTGGQHRGTVEEKGTRLLARPFDDRDGVRGAKVNR
ncbi:hypothetical protein Vau01_058800 [Virgisporangium aurantiacum]|uniref:Uncharacterized protein n=1 Tax=Virgisporangium aurantiacum TaxID=175570 RepID=A0A8J3Z6K2_9ACTN|nr:hypothetical protein Vau01_058800 [Virgisporangium aurantiacum]